MSTLTTTEDIPQTGWKYINYTDWQDDDETLMLSGLHFIRVNYTFLIIQLSEGEPDFPNTIQLSSSGSTSVKYPGSLGEYQLLQDRDHNGRPVYQSLASEGRYIIYIGKIYSIYYHNFDKIIHARISLVHHA